MYPVTDAQRPGFSRQCVAQRASTEHDHVERGMLFQDDARGADQIHVPLHRVEIPDGTDDACIAWDAERITEAARAIAVRTTVDPNTVVDDANAVSGRSCRPAEEATEIL